MRLTSRSKRETKAKNVRDYLRTSEDIKVDPSNPNYTLEAIVEARTDVLALQGNGFRGFSYGDLIDEYDRLLTVRAAQRLDEISKLPKATLRKAELDKLLQQVDNAGIDRRQLFKVNIERPLLRKTLPSQSNRIS